MPNMKTSNCAYAEMGWAEVLLRKFQADGLHPGSVLVHPFNGRYLVIGSGRSIHDLMLVREPKISKSEPPSGKVWKPHALTAVQWRQAQMLLTPGKLTGWIRLIQREISPYVTFMEVYDLFLQQGRQYHAVMVKNDTVYYFDEKLVYRSVPRSQAMSMPILLPADPAEPDIMKGFGSPKRWVKAAEKRFKEGMTLKECLHAYIHPEMGNGGKPHYTDLERLVQRIEDPCFERDLENTDTNTFNRIEVQVDLPSVYLYSWNDLRQEVKKHLPTITNMVASKVQTTERFRTQNLAMSQFRIASCVLSKDRTLVYVFEPKHTVPKTPVQ